MTASPAPQDPVAPAPGTTRPRPGFGLRSRIKAAATHFTLSLIVATAVFCIIYFVWFPGVLFDFAGGRALLKLIFVVDVTLGPLLTFVVFVPGKKSLVFDLAVIACLQLGALAYGVWTMFNVRPVYIVFAQDRFDLAQAADVSPQELERAKDTPYAKLPLDGPHLVGVNLPKDPDEQFAISQAALAGGPDLYGYPRFYRPYDEVRPQVLKASIPVDDLKRFNPPAAVDAEVAMIGRPASTLRAVPLRAGKVDLTVFVDAKSGDVVRFSALRPWK